MKETSPRADLDRLIKSMYKLGVLDLAITLMNRQDAIDDFETRSKLEHEVDRLLRRAERIKDINELPAYKTPVYKSIKKEARA